MLLRADAGILDTVQAVSFLEVPIVQESASRNYFRDDEGVGGAYVTDVQVTLHRRNIYHVSRRITSLWKYKKPMVQLWFYNTLLMLV